MSYEFPIAVVNSDHAEVVAEVTIRGGERAWQEGGKEGGGGSDDGVNCRFHAWIHRDRDPTTSNNNMQSLMAMTSRQEDYWRSGRSIQ